MVIEDPPDVIQVPHRADERIRLLELMVGVCLDKEPVESTSKEALDCGARRPRHVNKEYFPGRDKHERARDTV